VRNCRGNETGTVTPQEVTPGRMPDSEGIMVRRNIIVLSIVGRTTGNRVISTPSLHCTANEVDLPGSGTKAGTVSRVNFNGIETAVTRVTLADPVTRNMFFANEELIGKTD